MLPSLCYQNVCYHLYVTKMYVTILCYQNVCYHLYVTKMYVAIFMFHLYMKFLVPNINCRSVVATRHKAKTNFPQPPYQYSYIPQ